MAACTGLQNDSNTITRMTTKYDENARVWADTHLTGLNISHFEHERNIMQHERNMTGNEYKMKST